MALNAPKITFRDVAGADEAVAELREIVAFLHEPAAYQAVGARIPKGVLLYGPPGNGKTLPSYVSAGRRSHPPASRPAGCAVSWWPIGFRQSPQVVSSL